METTRLHTKLRELVDAKRELAAAKQTQAAAERRKKTLELEVHEMLREVLGPRAKGSFPVDLGEGYGVVRFTPNSTHYGQVLDRKMAEEALRQQGRDREEIITTKLREKQLNELVREKLENNEDLPEGIGFYTRDYVTVSFD